MQRPTKFDEHLDAINAAFPNGKTFTTGDAGDVLAQRFNINTATAVVYASATLRYLMDTQDACPDGDQLCRVSRRYVFQPAQD